MEQLINTMLASAQIPQAAPTVKKSEPVQKDDFQKLLEQKQSDAPEAPKQEKADASQQPQETQDAQKPQEAEQPQEAQPMTKEGKELEEQMVLAAMAMLQNPVVPVVSAEQVEVTPEVQAEAVVDDIAPVAAETLLAPEEQSIVPEAKQAVETTVEGGEVQIADQPLAEELPQTIKAPEASQETEGRTVEVKVETARPELQTEQAEENTEDAPELQDAEVAAPVFEDVKAVPVKVGEAPKAEKAEQPVEKQIVPKVAEALQNGETRVELQLTPENLGKVTVEMTWSKDGGLVVQFHAENHETQNLLSKDTANLAAMLGRETQEEVRVEVPRQEESQRQDLYEQQQEHHQRRQQEERRRQPASSEDFLQQLRLGLIPLDVE